PSGLGDAARGAPDALETQAVIRFRSIDEEAQAIQQRINQRRVEYHKKLAIPVACIVFVLIGAPLAIRFPRGGVGMVIAVSLAIFGIYYVGLIGGEEFGDAGRISPFWAMWAPNAVFLVLGLLSIPWLTKASAHARGGGWDDFWHSLRTLLARPTRVLRRARPAEAST
ncbi:MAG: LptF/LptG family permease, partial [Longimicrobiales bacterium]